MFSSKVSRFLVLVALIAAGIFLFMAAPGGPGNESVGHQQAVQALAPGGIDLAAESPILSSGAVSPVVVNLADIPAGVYDPDNQLDRWQRGEIDMDEIEGLISPAERAARQEAALKLDASGNVQRAEAAPVENLSAGVSFDSLDYTECCGGGGNVPPDPELAVGPNHVIAVVNVAFEIYNTNGASLVGPTTFASFMSSEPNCTGLFDPNVHYDESADRFILAIDADGTHYCIAVSQSGDPTGSWNLYSFTTATGRDFFDYPHGGVGNDAFYMGANIFRGNRFKEARIWAFDKNAMYAGQATASVTIGLGSAEDTPQPLNLHGWNQGTWPGSGPHYFLTETNYNGDDYTVFAWSDPFGANTFTTVGTVDLSAATGVSAGMPVDVPQSGGGTLQANDFRPQDFEYRNGYAWTANTIACNPGGGTVDCVRWAQIDPTNATVVDAGVYASNGEYRTFADLAVDHCDSMGIGYTKSSSSSYPGIWYTGREASDPAGTLQAEVQLKAGEINYTSFESSSPRRWGDYTEMTIAPDGVTFWYLGEYSKNTGTSNGRWGTYIGAFTIGSCSPGDPPPTPTPGPTAEPTATPGPTSEPTVTPEPTGITASANAYKVRGQKYIDVTWAGATSSNVDIYYNGSLYATTANDGFETIGSLGNGGGTWAVQVCEAGTSTCSNTVSGSW